MTGRFRRVDEIPPDQAAVVGANIRILRQQHGWNQARLGELMGWPSNSTVCAAEGRRNGRQRGFTTQEIERLGVIFGVSPSLLTTRCANCGGHPPAGSPARPAEPGPTHEARVRRPTITAGPRRRSRSAFGKATALDLRRRSSSRHP